MSYARKSKAYYSSCLSVCQPSISALCKIISMIPASLASG